MPTAADYLNLSVDDRIQLVQDIWASIAAEVPNPTLPLWQQEELDRRWAEYLRTPDDVQSWDEVRQEIEAELQG